MIPAYGAAVTAAWCAVALSGGVDSGDVHLTAAGAAAAAATAAVATAVRPDSRAATWIVLAGLLVLPVAVAWAASGENAAGLIVCLAPVAGVAAVGHGRLPRTGIVAFAGAALTAGAFAASSGGLRPFELVPDGSAPATFFVAGGLLLVGAATASAEPGVLRLLAVPGLVIAFAGVPDAPGRGVAATCAAVGVVAAIGLRRPPMAVALLAVAAAAVPGTGPAPRLLAAAAVLAVAVETPLVGVAATVPGLVALGAALAGVDLSLRTGAVAGAAIVVLAVLAGGVSTGPRPDVASLPATALAGWLFVLPTTWRWAGTAPSALQTYEDGALQALAAGLVFALGARIFAHLREPPLVPEARQVRP